MSARMLSPWEQRLLAIADARAAAVSVPTMRERVLDRLRAAVHDRFALEAWHASVVGDPWTEHAAHCDVPDMEPMGSEMDLGDGAGPVPVKCYHRRVAYPFRLGGVAIRRRTEYLAEHAQRLRALER